jgi:hypothetical protein
MPLIRRVAAVASTAAAARALAKHNPDKVNRAAEKAGQFVDRQTKGKYHQQIDNAMRKVRSFTGDERPGPAAPPVR